ncbi:hypothetical protein GGR51DRAFT_71746 [Nemania sp. FL0031]|nr:hypothetical protein GGR51DRAFT_71746 [Nemania sp. FL0031]
MVPLTESLLSVGGGCAIVAMHSIVVWFSNGWDHLIERFASIASSYIMLFCLLNLCSLVFDRIMNPASELLLAAHAKIQNSRIKDTTNPWIFITSVLIFCVALWCVYVFAILGWVSLHDMLHNSTSFFTPPHAAQVLHQMITATATMWFLIRLIRAFRGDRRKQSPHKEARSPQELSIQGNHMQQDIHRLVREIVANYNTYHLSQSSVGCKLEPGASLEQIRDLDRLVKVDLPKDYKIFLQLTNGLNDIPSGCMGYLQFISTNSADWLETVSPAEQDGRATWFIDSLFGPGIARELREAKKVQNGRNVQHRTSFHKIASGVYLVPPGDCRSIAREWVTGTIQGRWLCGNTIGHMIPYLESYFGDGDLRRLNFLQDWDEWLVLQVGGGEGRWRLYPSFTAFLQTLNKINQRPSPWISEETYAEYCRLAWDREWQRRSISSEWQRCLV